MAATRFLREWIHEPFAPSFQTGVSMHSHTLHSRESLDFIYKFASRSALIKAILDRGERKYRNHHGRALDLQNGWWTPPLGPVEAFRVEARQIEQLGMRPIVSLTDHDDIEAPVTLRTVEPDRDIPISVEWTVPYGPTFFHLGLHNLPPLEARDIMKVLAAFTASPSEPVLAGILSWFRNVPGMLVVFNHPMWDEMGVGESIHQQAAEKFLRAYNRCIHAVEMNGLRPWSENRLAIRFAETFAKPVVAGGDRHALEPNAVLNLSNAKSFDEFSSEIKEGWSTVWIAAAYRQSHNWRVTRNVVETLQPYENHRYGWTEWIDRTFYRYPDGSVLSFRQIWGQKPPSVIRAFDATLRIARSAPLRNAVHNLCLRLPQTLDSI